MEGSWAVQGWMQSRFGVGPLAFRVLVGNGISALGSGLTSPFLVIYLASVRGLGTAVAGLLVAYTAIVSLGLSALVGTLVDRYGPRPIQMAGLGVTACSTAALSLAVSVPSALVVLTVLAVGNSAVWAPQSALYARLTPPEHRQSVFGLQFMLLNLGLGVGGVIASFMVDIADPSSFVRLYLLDSLTYVAYFVILLTMRGVGVGPGEREERESGSGERVRSGYRAVFADRALRQLTAAAIVLLIFGYGSLEVGLPVYATLVGGLAPSFVGIAYAANTITVVVAQLFMLRWIAGRSRTRLGALVGLLWAGAWGFVGLSIGFPPWMAAGLICLGVAVFAIGETIWAPVAPAIVNDLAPDHLRGRYNAVISWSWGISGAVGPAFAALVLGLGHPVIWVASVVIGCLVGGAMILRLKSMLTPAQDGRIAA